MAILIDETTPVLVQGMTGDKGTFHSREMIAYGTNIVGGVTPGKGGGTQRGNDDEGNHDGSSGHRTGLYLFLTLAFSYVCFEKYARQGGF